MKRKALNAPRQTKKAKAKTFKKLPKFKTEEEEFKFWQTADSTDYVDWSKAKWVTFPNLKPTAKTISIRFPLWLLNDLKVMANKRDVPYQSMMKMILTEAVQAERRQ